MSQFQRFALFCIFSFPVTDALIGKFLEGLTIKEAISRKKLFIVNHSVLEGIKGFRNKSVSFFHLYTHFQNQGTLTSSCRPNSGGIKEHQLKTTWSVK